MSSTSAGPNSFDRLEVMYDRATRLPTPARGTFLDQVRDKNPALAEELDSLLEASAPASAFFRSLGKTLFSGSEGVDDPRNLIPSVDPLYGSSVGPYRNDTVVGRGGLGVVYRAVHRKTGDVLAIKFLPAYASASEEVRRRFIAEAQVTADVRHPNVGEILDISETEEGRLYLTMPFYEGESLKKRLKRGALPLEEALDWARQACAGLAAVHEAEIIHRDLTPGNILKTTDGVVKLLDFGLAKVADVTLGTGNRPLGTVAYMSPEQLMGDHVDLRTDLWSLGVVLHEMLVGERPFQGRTLSALRAQIADPASIDRPDVPDLPTRIGGLVASLLSQDREQRPASAQATLARLG